MFYGIKYLIVTLVFSHLGFWSGNLFLIASFSDLCLLIPFFFNIKFKIDDFGIFHPNIKRKWEMDHNFC